MKVLERANRAMVQKGVTLSFSVLKLFRHVLLMVELEAAKGRYALEVRSRL